jgi:hypothetical protein
MAGDHPPLAWGSGLGRGSFGRPAGFKRPTRRERTVDLHVLKDCEILNLVDAVPEHSSGCTRRPRGAVPVVKRQDVVEALATQRAEKSVRYHASGCATLPCLALAPYG